MRNTAYAEPDPRLGQTNRTTAGGTILSDFQYTRRAEGQITNVAESVTQPDNSVVTTTNVYTYDGLNRLTEEAVDTSAAGGDYTTDYTLDLAGNRVQKLTTKEDNSVERTESSYDARDRLLEEQVYDAATGGTLLDTIDYGYDTNSSLIFSHQRKFEPNTNLKPTQSTIQRSRK